MRTSSGLIAKLSGIRLASLRSPAREGQQISVSVVAIAGTVAVYNFRKEQKCTDAVLVCKSHIDADPGISLLRVIGVVDLRESLVSINIKTGNKSCLSITSKRHVPKCLVQSVLRFYEEV